MEVEARKGKTSKCRSGTEDPSSSVGAGLQFKLGRRERRAGYSFQAQGESSEPPWPPELQGCSHSSGENYFSALAPCDTRLPF